MPTYQDLLDDFTSSRFIKDVIRAANGCDPVDVLNDFELLAQAAQQKLDALECALNGHRDTGRGVCARCDEILPDGKTTYDPEEDDSQSWFNSHVEVVGIGTSSGFADELKQKLKQKMK